MILNVSYFVNEKRVLFTDLKKIKIKRKDYIDFVESIKKDATISRKEEMETG